MQYEPVYYIGKYRRHIIVTVITCVVLLVAITLYIQWRNSVYRAGKIAVPVEVVPRDATVKVNGTDMTSRGTVWIKPGEYTATAVRDGFKTQARPLRVSKDAVPYIYIALEGETDEAKQWQSSHGSDYQRLELLTAEKSRDYTVRFVSNNPIVNILPIKDPYYSIDYRNYDDKSIELIIYGTSPRYRKAAVDFLRKKGYEPTDFRVTYEGFVNPLGGHDE